MTWRATNLALQNNSQNLNSKSATLLKVLNTIKGPDGKITIIVVEVEDMLAAICDVKDSLLLAALVEVKAPRKLAKGVSKHSDTAVNGDHTSNTSKSLDDSINISNNNNKQVPSDSPHEQEQDEQDLPTPTPDKNNPKEEEEEEQQQQQEEEDQTPTSPPPSSSSTSLSNPKPSQMQILIWRAEAMAEALRDDLQDFKMPLGTL